MNALKTPWLSWLVAVMALSILSAAQGVSFQASSLPVQVRGEGLTETLGAVVLQATNAGKIAGGSSITFTYSGNVWNYSGGIWTLSANSPAATITNAPTIDVLQGSFANSGQCSGSACTGDTGSTAGSGFAISYNSSQVILTFTGNSSVFTRFSLGDYIEITQVRANVNALVPAANIIVATLAGYSSASVTNLITFTDSAVAVASIVNPSIQSVVTPAVAPISTCAVTAQSFSLDVAERYPAAFTSLTDESSFTPTVGTVSNGTQVVVTISNVPVGLAVTPGTPIIGNGSTLSFASTPAAATSTSINVPLTFVYTVTSDSTSFIDSATLPFTIGMPAGSSGNSIASLGAGNVVNVNATASIGPIQASSTTVAFAPNTAGNRYGLPGSTLAAQVSDCNPLPVVTSISPTLVSAGAAPFTLNVYGSGFGPFSTILWNGSSTNVTTNWVSSTQLTATISTFLVANPNTVAVTVVNSPPNGGTSQAQTLTVGNPVPVILSMSATSAPAGAPGFTLTVQGYFSYFVQGATVQWNGSARPTTWINSYTLNATISTNDLTTAGYFPVTITNPAPVTGPSDPYTFTVNNPTPAVSGLATTAAVAGSGAFFLSVTGSSFVNGATVLWNGSNRATVFGSSTHLTAAITAADLAISGNSTISVSNPAPNLGGSNGATFTVDSAAPTLTSLSINSAAAGSTAFLVTVSGSGFVSGATVQINGNGRTTIFGSSTSLGFLPSTADLASQGTLTVTVANPSPTVGPSNSLSFTVTGNNPVPTLVNLTPATVAVGSEGFTLTVYGSGFVPGSIVLWYGGARATTFVNSQQLSATINPADVAAARQDPVLVQNPLPGGGNSNVVFFTVGTSNQGTLAAQSVNGISGVTVPVPLVLTFNSGVSAGALTLSVDVVPGSGSPPLVTSLGFQSDPALPLPSGSPPSISASNASVTAYFPAFNTPLLGQVKLGVLQLPVPAAAAVGQSYTVQVTAASAALGSVAIPLASGANATVSVVLGYMAGDSYPHTGDSGGSFGDGKLTTLDLLDTLRAVAGISAPASCSDRYDALDTYPVDTATSRGGDGILDTLDLIATLQRVTNLDPSRPMRAPRGLACSAAEPEDRQTPARSTRDGVVDGTIEVQGNAIYLVARADLHLKGLALALNLQEGQQGNFTRGDIAPSIVDAGQAGRIAMAWLDGIKVSARQRLLLGYVDGADRGSVLSVTANNADGTAALIR